MQRSADRQKTLGAHGALLSDDRLPMTTLDLRDLTSIDGRILVHGEEETSGRRYLMLESYRWARLPHLPHTRDGGTAESARAADQFIHSTPQIIHGARPGRGDQGHGRFGSHPKQQSAPSRDGARNDSNGRLPPRMTGGTDGSATIRKPWLTPHSHWNRRRRKNANDAGVEALAVSGFVAAVTKHDQQPFLPNGAICSTSKRLKSQHMERRSLSLIAGTTRLLAVGWCLMAIRSRLQENRPHSHGVGESIRPFDTASSAALMKLR